MSTTENLPIFVYGTLKRGEERERCWPRPALSVEPALVRGALYDLGPYPALAEGDDWVLGELWQIAPADLPLTLQVLDEIECFGNSNVDLYVRRIVECHTLTGESQRAWIYFYANTAELAATSRIRPDQSGHCSWHIAFRDRYSPGRGECH